MAYLGQLGLDAEADDWSPRFFFFFVFFFSVSEMKIKEDD